MVLWHWFFQLNRLAQLWEKYANRAQLGSDMVAQTGRSAKVDLTRSLWQGRSDRVLWQVALTSTCYSSNKPSDNFVWPTLNTYSSLDQGTLADMIRIWSKSGPRGQTKSFSAPFVRIWGPNHWRIWTTTDRAMRRPTLNQVSYLLNVLRYLLPYIGELHRKSHRPPTMCSYMMLYYVQCNIQIIRPSVCSPSGWVSSCCPWRTGGEISLDMCEHTICDCCCPFDSHSCTDHTMQFRDPAVWWDPQSEIREWLWEKCLIELPNVGVFGHEYSREDWQITDT